MYKWEIMGCIRLAMDRSRALQAANYSHYAQPVAHPDRIMRVHDLFLVTRGEMEVWEEGTAFLLRPGDVVFLSAGRHHYGVTGCRKGTRTMWLHTYTDRRDAFLETDRLPENTMTDIYLNPLIATDGDPRFPALFESIIRGYWSSSVTRRIMGRAMFSELLIELSARSHAATDSSVTAIDHLIDYMERHPGQFFPIDALASRVGLNRRTLTTHFRRRTGESVHGFQTKLKIRMAAATFDHIPETPVKEVARIFGFHDEFHFSKTFKRVMGAAPQQYKQRFNRRK